MPGGSAHRTMSNPTLKAASDAASQGTEAWPTMPPLDDAARIGQGRSGIVFADTAEDGDRLASKVFGAGGLTKAVQWILLGAPNPYFWNADAVTCAQLRRDILEVLVPVWMDGEVTVAGAKDVRLTADRSAFALRTRFVAGRPARLRHALQSDRPDEGRDLWQRVLPKLRGYLEVSGFDGLLWQAGIGNPVAMNNFLLEPSADLSTTPGGDTRSGRWVWIDLESGVPAVFPISPLVFLRYSMRLWRRLGRVPFDDVDTDRLLTYLAEDPDDIRTAIGDESMQALVGDVGRLRDHQQRWKALPRRQSAIAYRLKTGAIDREQAAFYETHPLAWHRSQIRYGIRSVAKGMRKAVSKCADFLRGVPLRLYLSVFWRFVSSQAYRERAVHAYLEHQIGDWIDRGQLTSLDAALLRRQIGIPESSVYTADFGIHLALKPVVKIIQYWLLPALFAFGLISGPLFAVLLLTGGAVARTAYTLGRLIQSAGRGLERPWIALLIGVLPVVGNLAYPGQMLVSARDDNEHLARFLLDDGFARIGRHLPIWGGQDTWTEHCAVRIPGGVLERLDPHRSRIDTVQYPRSN